VITRDRACASAARAVPAAESRPIPDRLLTTPATRVPTLPSTITSTDSTAMTLDHQSKYPAALHYVVKLHRDAVDAGHGLAGRLENMSTGRRCEFVSGEHLLALLAGDLELTTQQAPGD
jgi:hypothetical protein